jgi:hypothetical protein
MQNPQIGQMNPQMGHMMPMQMQPNILQRTTSMPAGSSAGPMQAMTQRYFSFDAFNQQR